MTIQLSTTVRNARLDVIETTIGASAILSIWSGAPPSDCSQANTGTRLASITLPSDWMTDAASGTKSKNGTWQDTSADNTGTAGHFRIHNSGGTVCHMQGTVALSAADMIVDSTSFTAGQQFTVTQFDLTDNNG